MLNNTECNVLVAEVLLYVHKNWSLLGTGAQDGHLDFHTAPELCQCNLVHEPIVYITTPI